MRKIYRILLLLITLIFLSTYSPNKFKSNDEEKNLFFNIKNIIILNTSLIKEEAIKQKLRSVYNQNIFFVKKEDITEPLKGIDFFDKVEVKKKYPNTILLTIFETNPVAILFKNKDKYRYTQIISCSYCNITSETFKFRRSDPRSIRSTERFRRSS